MATELATGRRRSVVRGVALLVLAVVVGATALAVFTIAANGEYLEVDENGSTVLDLQPHTRYGLYFDDADNTGYSVDCSATDENGRQVLDDDVPQHFSLSSEEYPPNLDYVFDSGSGRIEVTCDVGGAAVLVRALPGGTIAVMLALVAAAALGSIGVCVLAKSGRPPMFGPDHRPTVVAIALAALPFTALAMMLGFEILGASVGWVDPDVLGSDWTRPSVWDRFAPLLPDLAIVTALAGLFLACWVAARRGRERAAWALAVVAPTATVAAFVAAWL